jgi:hypothetical protein
MGNNRLEYISSKQYEYASKINRILTSNNAKLIETPSLFNYNLSSYFTSGILSRGLTYQNIIEYVFDYYSINEYFLLMDSPLVYTSKFIELTNYIIQNMAITSSYLQREILSIRQNLMKIEKSVNYYNEKEALLNAVKPKID